MARYMKIEKGIECQIKRTKGVISFRKCRRIDSKKSVSFRTLLN